jgi:hypothetical protein
MVAAVVKKKRFLGAAAIVALMAGPALAHPEVSPLLVNRYLSIIVVGDRLEFFVTLLYGAAPGLELRKELDVDRDGTVTTTELDRAAQRWRTRARELVTIALDGKPMPLDEATANLQLGADQTVNAAPVVVEVYGTRTISPHRHELRLEPGWEPLRLGETELSLDLSADWELVASRQGSGAEGTVSRFLFEGPRPSVVADRSASFRLRPVAPPGQSRATTLVAAGIAALAGAGLFLEVRRRRRRGSQVTGS